MQIKRRIKRENELSSTEKELYLYLSLATSKVLKYDILVNSLAFTNEKGEKQTLSRRTIFRYIEHIKPLFLDSTIRVVPKGKEPKMMHYGNSIRYIIPRFSPKTYRLGLENSYIVLVEKKNTRLVFDADYCVSEPIYSFNLPPVASFDKNDKKRLKLLRLATIFDLNINYFMEELFYYDLGVYIFETRDKDDKQPKPIARELLPKLNKLGFENLTIRTVERDLKMLNDTCALLKKNKLASGEWILDR